MGLAFLDVRSLSRSLSSLSCDLFERLLRFSFLPFLDLSRRDDLRPSGSLPLLSPAPLCVLAAPAPGAGAAAARATSMRLCR